MTFTTILTQGELVPLCGAALNAHVRPIRDCNECPTTLRERGRLCAGLPTPHRKNGRLCAELSLYTPGESTRVYTTLYTKEEVPGYIPPSLYLPGYASQYTPVPVINIACTSVLVGVYREEALGSNLRSPLGERNSAQSLLLLSVRKER